MLLRASALLLLVLPTLAEAGFYCTPPDELNQNVEDCTDNDYMSEAAVLCLQKFEKSIKVAQAAVKTTTAAQNAAAKKTQAGKQNNAMLNYNFSKATLDSLIAQGKQAQEEVAFYYDDVALPEDTDEPRITGPDLQAFLDSNSCYKDNRDAIAMVLEDFDHHLSELQGARDVSQDLENATNKNETQLDTINSGQVTGGKAAAGAGVPKGKKVAPKSTITGVEEDQAKQKK